MDEFGNAGGRDILYRLGKIEAKLEANAVNWSEPVKRIEELLTKLEAQINKDMTSLSDEININRNNIRKVESRIDQVSGELSTWKTRIMTGVSIISVSWIVFGDYVKTIVERTF